MHAIPLRFYFAGIILFASALHFIFIFTQFEQEFATAVAREIDGLEAILAITSEGLIALLVGGELANIYDQLDIMAAQLPMIERMELLDSDGRSLYPLMQSDIFPLREGEHVVEHDIGINSTVLGKLIVVLDTTPISTAAATHLWQTVGISVLMITGISVFTLGLIEAAIARPIGQLKHIMARTAHKNGSPPGPMIPHAPKELHELTDSFAQAEQALSATADRLKIALNREAQASAAKSQFVANMSHELRTPLSGIMGLTEWMIQTETDPQRCNTLQVVHSSGERLLSHLNDILDITRLETGRMQRRDETVDLHDILHNTLQLFKATAKQKAVQLQGRVQGHRYVQLDRGKVLQVISNLVSNAIKFTPNGQVDLTLTVDKGQLTVAVVDTGCGIPQDHLTNIFDRFTQVDSSRNRAFGGAGLGLAICKELIEFMGGQIKVRSTMGQGSCFTCILPVVIKQKTIKTVPPPSTEPQVNPTLQGLNICIADDEPINRLHLRKLLEYLGVTQITEAKNGAEALQQVQAHTPDLILMDLHMPTMNGLEATQTIKQIPNSKAIKIYGYTANILPQARRDCLAAGMDHVLIKPLSLDGMRKVLMDKTV
ncbi:MAG: ATP-binding protein [Pseudomonadota bacterium]